MMKDQIAQFLVNKGLVSKRQHASIKSCSTPINLLAGAPDWIVSLNSHVRTDVAYKLTFRKRRSDSIVITKVLFKWEMYGILGQLMKWISCILRERTPCVVVGHCFWPVCSVANSVPQGSVLGPLLFRVFINNVDAVCKGDHTEVIHLAALCRWCLALLKCWSPCTFHFPSTMIIRLFMCVGWQMASIY